MPFPAPKGQGAPRSRDWQYRMRRLPMRRGAEGFAGEGLRFGLLDALIWQESRYNPAAVSSAGAGGLTQLMPGTASDLGVKNRFDPSSNIDGGARYLRLMLNKFREIHLALAAYNAGPGAVARAKGIPRNRETPGYVRKVLARWTESGRQDREIETMNRSKSNRLRLTGTLIKGDRHYILKCEDDSVWRLACQDIDIPEDGGEVTVEGTNAGKDTIDVDWIGTKHVR